MEDALSENQASKLEQALRSNLDNIFRAAAQSANIFYPLLGDSAFKVMISEFELYLRELKNIEQDCIRTYIPTRATRSPTAPNPLLQSPLFNDSMVLHRTRLSRSSKSRLNLMRNTPENNEARNRTFDGGSPMEIGRNLTIISPLPDATREMDDSMNEGGFLADVSDMNGTVRSRAPSFNFDSISPVVSSKSLPTGCEFDFEHETPLFVKMMSDTAQLYEQRQNRSRAGFDEGGGEAESTILVSDISDIITPYNEKSRRANKTINIDFTPQAQNQNLWNVKLRSGSNRKISEEIRRIIQEQG